MKNIYLIIGIVALIALVGGFYYYDVSSRNYVPDNSGAPSGNSQQITLSMKNGNYYPNTITVKVGEPVQIRMDSSVGGCYRVFKIPALGQSKYFQTADDVLEFTPTEKGTYKFQCTMGMGTGTLIVE